MSGDWQSDNCYIAKAAVVQGRAIEDGVIAEVSSPGACEEACVRRAGDCDSFVYSQKAKKCWLNNGALWGRGDPSINGY